MNLAIRIFAIVVIAAGAAAAATPKTGTPIASHQSATASLPGPTCNPYICPPDPGPDGQ
jgi:hypothetical protein